MRKLVLDLELSCILLLPQYCGGQSPPILETNSKNVQDLLKNIKLTFTCSFGYLDDRAGSAVSVERGGAMAVETPVYGIALTVVNGLNNARTTYNITLNRVTVSVTTTRTLNNLTFSCINTLRDGSVVINSSQPIVVKCEIVLQ